MENRNNVEQTSLKVVIRVRPLNKKEIEGNHQIVWNIDCDTNCICSQTQSGKRYSFDRIYSPTHTTKDIYNESMSPVIKAFITGFNGTIFAYGQTSSGKTFTMMGSGGNKDDGIIHKAIKYIFRCIRETTDREYTLNASYLEIYNESIKDLLTPSNVELKISMDNFHRPVVRGLTTKSIMDRDQIFKVLNRGMSNRNIGSTKMNDQSSRSHTIFQVQLESRERSELDGSVRSSVLNIVDLAGSERAKKTDASGKRLKEGGHINKSLLTLGIVIKKLSDVSTGKVDAGHIPYRDSKLTHILEPALGGNSKTVVICTMTPADIHHEESISTLGFASRAKEVKNCASVVEIRDESAIIKRQQKQIIELQRRLYEQNGTHHNTVQTEAYEKRIDRLKEICSSTFKDSDQDEDIDIQMEPIIEDVNKKKKKSVLGKRRRHSVAFGLGGTPARKRLKTQLAQNLPRARHSSYATPLNKIRTQKDEMAWKLRKATHISKGLQQELNAKYQDFNEMQIEIDRLCGVNKILSQKVEFFESSIADGKDKDDLMEKQRLTLKINLMQQTEASLRSEISQYEEGLSIDKHNEINTKLREELQHSQCTIDQLQHQIAELRLNIEQQISSREISVDQPINVLFQMNISKLQSQLILIKNDKASLQQIINNQQKQLLSFKNECLRQFEVRGNMFLSKMNSLQKELDESNDEKHLFESQYHQIREEREEMRNELEMCRRPENEIIEELQSELLNIQKQSDIDTNHTFNTNNESSDKLMEIENLKEINAELNENMVHREREINEECDVKMNELRMEMEDIKQLNGRLENEIASVGVSQMGWNKIDSMNISQLKDALKNMKRTLREQQSKMGAIERKKDVHEKTAQKYNKRCGELEQRFKKLSRENNNVKSQFMSTTKLNKRLKTKNDKLQKDIKKIQNDTVNAKDLNRKLNITTKRLESVQNKYDMKHKDLESLKLQKMHNMKEMNGLKDNLNTMNQCNKKLEKIRQDLENNICEIQNEKNVIIKELKTEKDVITMLKEELKKFHQINGEQNCDLKKTKENIVQYKEEIDKLNVDIAALNGEIKVLQNHVKDRENELEELKQELNDVRSESKEKQDRMEQQNESLKLNLSAMKETDSIQRNEIDETNKMLRELQIELNENKKELRDYQNRWQHERKANDLNIEKLRGFELKINNLFHENQMNRTTIESKSKEIERLNVAAKEQQEILLKTISESADYKTRCESYDNVIDCVKQDNQLLLKEKNRLIESMQNKQDMFNQIKCDYNNINNEYNTLINNLEKSDSQIADLKKEKKEMHYKLNKKITELTEATNALCDLQNEMEQNCSIYKEIENERNSLQIQYTELIKKYQESEIELNSSNDRLRQIENNLKETMNQLQSITLQNDRLNDDLKEDSILEKKYAKAKEYINQLQTNDAKLKAALEKRNKRESKYEHAISEWKHHSQKLENKIKEQQIELKNLRPSKTKARKFEQLCKEYHYAKTNIFKAGCICKQTQTNECRLHSYNQNKENFAQSQQTAK